MTEMPRMIRQQQLTSSIAQQLLQELNTGSGWDELSLEAIPVGDDISATVRQRTGDEVISNGGVLARDMQLSKDVMSLREATLSAERLAADLTRFPRQRANIPQWVVDRIGAAGLEVPSMSAEE